MQDIHHGDHGEKQRGDREGGLIAESLQDQDQKRDGHRAVEAEHDAAVQELAHLCHEDDAEDQISQVGIDKDAAADKLNPRLVDEEGGTLGSHDDIRRHGGSEEQICRQKEDPLLLIPGHFADIGDIIDKNRQQQRMENTAHPVCRHLIRRR